MNGINPEAYLTDVLSRIAEHPIQGFDELTCLWGWQTIADRRSRSIPNPALWPTLTLSRGFSMSQAADP